MLVLIVVICGIMVPIGIPGFDEAVTICMAGVLYCLLVLGERLDIVGDEPPGEAVIESVSESELASAESVLMMSIDVDTGSPTDVMVAF